MLDIFEAVNAAEPTWEVLGFIVEAGYGEPGTRVNDLPILGDLPALAGREHEVSVICGVAAPEVRARMVERARAMSLRFASVVHPSVVKTRRVQIGEGSIICAGCILTNQIVVGNHVQINLDCTVGHDAVLEDYATFAPGVHVSGNVVCEEGALVGTGANIIPELRIGAWSIVGAGTTVIRDGPPNVTVAGNPAREIARREPGWQCA